MLPFGSSHYYYSCNVLGSNCENMIMNIMTYSVIIFLGNCLIREIKNAILKVFVGKILDGGKFSYYIPMASTDCYITQCVHK